MRRLRFFRILLPVLLLGLGALVVYSFNMKTGVHTTPAVPDPGADRVRGVHLSEWTGKIKTLTGRADLLSQDADGRIHVEGLEGLELPRKSRGPLVVDATIGDGEGQATQRRWAFKEGVVLSDPEEQLELRLPRLDVDEVHGEARSHGDIQLAGPRFSGRASAVTYGLAGQPGELIKPVLEDVEGARLTAERAVLLDGVRDVEFRGEVRVLQRGGQLNSSRLRIVRAATGHLRRAVAGGGVVGAWPVSPGILVDLEADRLEVDWDEVGEPRAAMLEENASVSRGNERIDAREIVASRTRSGSWEIRARDGATVRGMLGTGPGTLQAEMVTARIGSGQRLQSAEAVGQVRFEGQGITGESDRATLEATPLGHEIQLFSDGRRKARLAQGQTRVAGDWIRTDPEGDRMLVRGGVEASLLPGGDGPGLAAGQLFRADEAVHFVSDRLEGRAAGTHLTFSGTVRGWQGERNLAAESIIVDQGEHSFEAIQNVTSRVPRDPGARSASADDYLLVSADHLVYHELTALAVYTGDVRLRIVEGWLESQRIEVELDPGTGDVKEVRASEAVRLEFDSQDGDGESKAVAGTADRVVYVPGDERVLLYGDRSPAVVRRVAGGGGTTTGRVLSYRLDLGTLAVEAGAQGPAQIRTGGGNP